MMENLMMPLAHIQNQMDEIIPAKRYREGEPFSQWQAQTRDTLRRCLGLDRIRMPDRIEVQVAWSKPQDGFTEIRFQIQTEPGFWVPGHLWLPDGDGKLPLMICLQGHSTGMHISMGRTLYERDVIAGDRDFAVQAVARGYAALTLEQPGFGELGGTENGPDCTAAAQAALLIGRTLLGQRVHNVMCAITAASQLSQRIDLSDVSVMGNSGGGTTSFYSACMDERIGMAIVSCAFCTYRHSIAGMRHCACNYLPGIRLDYEMGDLAGLIAPRRLLIVAGREDQIFPLNGVHESMAQAEPLFEAAGAPQNIRLTVGGEGHRFYAAQAWEVVSAWRASDAMAGTIRG